MRPLIIILMGLILLLAACSDNDRPTSVSGPEDRFPLDLRLVNDGEETILTAGIQALIWEPGEADPKPVVMNWQRPAKGQEMVFTSIDSVERGSVLQVHFLISAFWNEHDPFATWRAWSSARDTVFTTLDAQCVFSWPVDRFIYPEVSWPPAPDSGTPDDTNPTNR